MTSGAIQNGVPTNVFLLICVSVNWPATPKSASLTSPCSESNTLAAKAESRVIINVRTLHRTKINLFCILTFDVSVYLPL